MDWKRVNRQSLDGGALGRQGFPGTLVSKESACNAGDMDSILGREDHLEKEMATHSRTLAWKIPWKTLVFISLLHR